MTTKIRTAQPRAQLKALLTQEAEMHEQYMRSHHELRETITASIVDVMTQRPWSRNTPDYRAGVLAMLELLTDGQRRQIAQRLAGQADYKEAAPPKE